MEEKLTMTMREIDRLHVIKRVSEGELTWREGGEELGLCERQVGRLCRQLRESGAKGLIHGLRGRSSSNKLSEELVKRAQGIVREKYYDFGPTFAWEKLWKEEGIRISVSSLRRAMIEAGLWRAGVRRIRHRAWRARRARVGMLVQIDGSEHDWFEGRGPRCVLVGFIDDASSRVMYAEFVESEDTLALMRLTKEYVELYGRPVEVYVDKDSIYRINRQASIEEDLRDRQPKTQYVRAIEELGIKVIWAHSPQAKGRIERLFGTLQDRLVKELRLAGISDREAANRYLRERYLSEHNSKYARPPANEADAHRSLLKEQRLEEIFSLRSERTVANDWTIRFQSRLIQLAKEQTARVRPGDKVSVEIRLDGSLHLRFRGRYLHFKTLETDYRPGIRDGKPRPGGSPRPKLPATEQRPWRPPPDHPWRHHRIGRAAPAPPTSGAA